MLLRDTSSLLVRESRLILPASALRSLFGPAAFDLLLPPGALLLPAPPLRLPCRDGLRLRRSRHGGPRLRFLPPALVGRGPKLLHPCLLRGPKLLLTALFGKPKLLLTPVLCGLLPLRRTVGSLLALAPVPLLRVPLGLFGRGPLGLDPGLALANAVGPLGHGFLFPAPEVLAGALLGRPLLQTLHGTAGLGGQFRDLRLIDGRAALRAYGRGIHQVAAPGTGDGHVRCCGGRDGKTKSRPQGHRSCIDLGATRIDGTNGGGLRTALATPWPVWPHPSPGPKRRDGYCTRTVRGMPGRPRSGIRGATL